MQESWFQRVEHYLDEVEAVAQQIEAELASTRLQTDQMNAAGVDRSNVILLESLAAMESKIAVREQLLHADDAPQLGATLTEKIRCTENPGYRELVEHCQAVSTLISSVNQKAISLFVCQFHLSQLSGDIVRLLSGQTAPPTYQAPNRSEKKGDLGGGLFNEAA